ncbi:hypothetical protein L2E82_50723 [Cichorium intybus]|nr:hypothetical protein L2E82_50723 [Cichorium intybus]
MEVNGASLFLSFKVHERGKEIDQDRTHTLLLLSFIYRRVLIQFDQELRQWKSELGIWVLMFLFSRKLTKG